MKEEKTKIPNSKVEELRQFWKETTGTDEDCYEYGKANSTRACKELIIEKGEDKLREMIRLLPYARRYQYTPRITGFMSLKYKWGRLEDWAIRTKIKIDNTSNVITNEMIDSMPV